MTARDAVELAIEHFLLLLVAVFVSSYNSNEYRSFEGVDETGAN